MSPEFRWAKGLIVFFFNAQRQLRIEQRCFVCFWAICYFQLIISDYSYLLLRFRFGRKNFLPKLKIQRDGRPPRTRSGKNAGLEGEIRRWMGSPELDWALHYGLPAAAGVKTLMRMDSDR